ncbi:hypothetical protein D7X98_18080 [bacterium 1XD8-76]|nr:hypothetical protein D7X98_18080 [bacterium 1XD8-76]
MNYLIIDVGTSSMRGILFRSNGKMLHVVQKEYQVISLENGLIEQNPLDFKNSMKEIAKVMADFSIQEGEMINAIVLTSQRSSVIPVDREGNHLCNAQMWQDKRTVTICREMESYHREIFQLCGSRVNPVFSGTKMKWFKRNRPDIYEKAWKLIVIPDYLFYHMTGNFFTDYTYGSRSLLMNLKSCSWDERLLELMEIDKEKLCELKAPGSIMGSTTKKFAEETGILEGVPVISAGGDQQCGMLGQGVVEHGDVSLTLGTGGFLLTACHEIPQHLDWDVVCNASSVSGEYILEASMLTCTSAMEWFKQNFYREEQNFYRRLNEILNDIPAGAHGCRALPYFQGRSTPDWNSSATAAFCNVTLNTSREDMLKALLESICMEIWNNISSFEKYVPTDKILVSGGFSKSEAFNQMQADVYGKRVVRMNNEESTAIGALMVAAVAMKEYRTIKEAFSVIRDGAKRKEYQVRKENHVVYEKLKEEMEEIYQKMQEKRRI